MAPIWPRSPGSSSRRGFFSYGIAASYIGKGLFFDPTKHILQFDPSSPAQQEKQELKLQQLQQRQQNGWAKRDRRIARPESGQDAFFISQVGDTGCVALGVADGVGGWMNSGVDPADFSHGLCEYMAAVAYTHQSHKDGEGGHEDGETDASSPSSPPGPHPPLPFSTRQLMQAGYDAVHRDRTIRAGGSTAIVGLLTPQGMLEVANLGDSGFLHLRRNAVHAASEPQTHGFNTPFQLSMVPPGLLARMAAFGGAQLSDQPRDADVCRYDLRHGDVLVFASDGVWDNLFTQEILHLVSDAMTRTGAWHSTDDADGVRVASAAHLRRLMDSSTGEGQEGQEGEGEKEGDGAVVVTPQSLIATHITAAARANSVNTKRDGPFSKEVKRYYPQEAWHGGKVDDICVVVAVVSEETAAADGGPAIKSRL